jgi:hypothetical protein
MGIAFTTPRNYVSVVRDELIVLHSALSAVGASAPLDKSSNAGHQRLIIVDVL